MDVPGRGWSAALEGDGAANEALLVEQLAEATRQLRARETEGRRTEIVRAVVNSLRMTLGSIAQKGTVEDPSVALFVLKSKGPEELEFWHRGKKLRGPFLVLEEAIRESGIRLRPGQIVILHGDLAQRAIEASLIGLAQEELRLREAKRALLLALSEGQTAP